MKKKIIGLVVVAIVAIALFLTLGGDKEPEVSYVTVPVETDDASECRQRVDVVCGLECLEYGVG